MNFSDFFAAPESPLRANSPFASLPLARNRLRSYFGGDAKQLPHSKGLLLNALVGLDGLEPSTSRLSGARSSHLSYRPLSLSVVTDSVHLGGDEGNRTLDPLLAGQVLSQLSYTPDRVWSFIFANDPQKLNSKSELCKHRTTRQSVKPISEYGSVPQNPSRFSIERR